MNPSELTRVELETAYIRMVDTLLQITRYKEYATHKCPKLAEETLRQVGISTDGDTFKKAEAEVLDEHAGLLAKLAKGYKPSSR